MRSRINLNREWMFYRGDVAGAEAVDFDDSSWEPVGLPHTFDLPYFRTAEFYVGVGWYRKRIHSRDLGLGKWLAARLEFDGAFQVATVFMNGRHIGEHRGGYTGFDIDLGFRSGENVLAVRVSNEWDPGLAPRAGEHIFSGGLYRDVYLAPGRPIIGRHDIVITTPQVSRESAVVNVRTILHNGPFTSLRCTVRQTILDPDGVAVATFQSTRRLEADQRVELDQTSAAIANPKLWHPDRPNLYTLRTEIGRKQVRPYAETKFGFRWFEWTADRGFFLNGEHLYLRGANVHQDHAGWGVAVTRTGCERDVRLIKEAGFNFIRGAHYPHHPAFADACDRFGLLFWSENAFWGKGGFGPEGYWNASAYPVDEKDFAPFEESCKQQLAEMIRINRNHPSIIAWSMTNEAFFTYNLERAKRLMSDLVALSHELDPTRPAAIGGAQRGDVDKLGDIAGYNGDGARLFIKPGVPNMVSEYGAISKPHDAYEPFFGEKQAEEFPWRAGEAIWAGFDYGSIAGKQGLKGILDHFRLPKASWYWYRDHYLNASPSEEKGPTSNVQRRTSNVEPASQTSSSVGSWKFDVGRSTFSSSPAARLDLQADKTTIQGTDATDDAQIIVTVCDGAGRPTNRSPAVTLTIESGPGEFPTGDSITFTSDSDIQIIAGRAAIEFRSYHGGESVIRATSTGLADATIAITTIGEPAFVPGVTPPARPRPYMPPPESEAARRAMRNAVNVALNRPSRASDESSGHPARHANDGDAATAWQSDDPLAWWLVDLEGFYQLASLKLVFAGEGNYRFRVEASVDAQAWTCVVDRADTTNTRATRNDIFPPATMARYVRIRFAESSPPPALAEVELQGVIAR